MKLQTPPLHRSAMGVALLVILAGATAAFNTVVTVVHAEDEIVIMDDAPAEDAGAIGDGEISIGGSEEVSLDLEAGSEDFFNPYVFERDPKWGLLPLFALILVGLHLLPVPKSKKRKLVPMTSFFRHASGARGAPDPRAVAAAAAAASASAAASEAVTVAVSPKKNPGTGGKQK